MTGLLNEWILSDRFGEVASRGLDLADCGKTRREGAVGSCVEVAVVPDRVRGKRTGVTGIEPGDAVDSTIGRGLLRAAWRHEE